MRLKNIDYFKGVLTILVIVGHLIQGTLEESFSRYLIYSFHMPIFIGISGFLLNINKVMSLNVVEVFKKYQFRVIIPWIISVIFYFFLINDNYSLFLLIKSFITPYYHLWFIPGFLSWIILLRISKRVIKNENWVLICALIISILSLIIKEKGTNMIPGSGIVLHTFRPYFFFFFVLGNHLNRVKVKSLSFYSITGLIVLIALEILLFFYNNPFLENFNFFALNTVLLFSLLTIAKQNLVKESRFIQWIGINSLAIYLWHVVPIILVKNFIGTDQLSIFYLVTVLSEIAFIIVYFFMIKSNFCRKYIFGL